MAFKRDEAYEEQHKYIARIIWGIFVSIGIVWFCTLLFLPMTSWLINGFGMEQLGKAWAFWKRCAFNVPELVVAFKDVVVNLQVNHRDTAARFLPYLSFPIAGTFLVYWIVTNPYKYLPNVFGSGRKATYDDIKKMKLYTL